MSGAQEPEGFDVHPHVKVFARAISQGPLGLALYWPQSWAQPTRCFENATRQAEQQGGRALFGWMFHYRVVADIAGPGYLIAVHHAVWHAPTGQLVDVTPFHADPKHHPIAPGGDVLFLVDSEARPVAVGSNITARPSRFHAIDLNERLVAHVNRLQEEENEACRKLYRGGE